VRPVVLITSVFSSVECGVLSVEAQNMLVIGYNSVRVYGTLGWFFNGYKIEKK